MEYADVIVIGAGFGGLACALRLAERGARVSLLEQLNYAGGCASTFSRSGRTFEAGATLFAGFDANQVFGRWIAEHKMQVTVDKISPLVTLRTPAFSLDISSDKEAFVRAITTCHTQGPASPAQMVAREAALQRFFAHQDQVAAALWQLFDDPELLPPLSVTSVLRHLSRSPRYLPVLGAMGRSVVDIATRYGVQDDPVLRVFLDAVCQITVQCNANEAEAPFALSALDYFWRGAGHVRGGIGVLAHAMVDAIRNLGGEVSFADRAQEVRRDNKGWVVTSRKGTRRAPEVVLNLLPSALKALVPADKLDRRVSKRDAQVRRGWGAVMLYRAVRPPEQQARSLDASPDGQPWRDTLSAQHYQLIGNPSLPFSDGNHVFVSIAGEQDGVRSDPGERTLTASTHVRIEPSSGPENFNDPSATDRGGADRGMDHALARPGSSMDPALHIAGVQARMRSTIATLLPEWSEVRFELTASPRTFQRFTARPDGFVGGVPRRVGWSNYALADLGPARVAQGMWMVGDSVFPGQSTLAVAIGGIRTADLIVSRRPLMASLPAVRTK